MFGLKDSDIELIVRVLRFHPDVKEALIFGSRAMGNYKPGSDVDIALKGNLDSETAINVSVELNERTPLPYKFDVLDYSSLSHSPLIEHIDQYGKVFYQHLQ
jgi:predicted nucleotidyltransferase